MDFGNRVNFIRIYCEESDLVYAEDVLRSYRDIILETSHNGQFFTVKFDISGVSPADCALWLVQVREEMSRCIRRHRRLSKPPPKFPAGFPNLE